MQIRFLFWQNLALSLSIVNILFYDPQFYSAIFSGELPWDEPSISCEEYSNWLEHKIQFTPWSKIGTLPLALLRKILVHDPKRRTTISDMKKDR